MKNKHQLKITAFTLSGIQLNKTIYCKTLINMVRSRSGKRGREYRNNSRACGENDLGF